LCLATLQDSVPKHLEGKGTGWVTAEYAMLPRSTPERSQRESIAGRPGGRTFEIQRLVGRALRAAVDLKALGPRSVIVDCEVIEVQGTAEGRPFTREDFDRVLALSLEGIAELVAAQRAALV